MLTATRGRTANRRAARSLARKSRPHRRQRQKSRSAARRVAGLGRSKSEKRVARAGWLDLIITETETDLNAVLDNISTGRDRMLLPKISPAAPDTETSESLKDAILDLLPGKEEQLRDALFDDTTAAPPAPKAKAGGLSSLAASPLLMPAIMIALMALKG